MSLLIATSNEGKVREFELLLAPLKPLLRMSDPKFLGNFPPLVKEDGETYFENALKKALAYYKVYQVPVLADDSGLEIDALQGAPGIHSARFGGTDLTFPERWSLIQSSLANVPPERRTCRFRCVLCFFDGNGVPVFFQGTVDGRIAPAPAGKSGFGYDPLFYSVALGKTFGEATTAEKDRISHRAEAVEAFVKWWKLDRSRP